MRVVFQTSISGPVFGSFYAGQTAEIDDKEGERLLKAGIVRKAAEAPRIKKETRGAKAKGVKETRG